MPVPPSARDAIEAELFRVADPSLRWKVRRLAEFMYHAGYDQGHLDGGREERADREEVRVHRVEHPEELREQVRTYLADRAPTWEHTFPDGETGPVLSLSDAATVAGQFITSERIP